MNGRRQLCGAVDGGVHDVGPVHVGAHQQHGFETVFKTIKVQIPGNVSEKNDKRRVHDDTYGVCQERGFK